VLGFTALTLGLAAAYVATRGSVTVEKMDSAGPYGVGYRRTLFHDSQRDQRAVPVDCWYPLDPKSTRGQRAFYLFAKTPLKNLGFRSSTAIQDAAAEFPQPMPLIIFSHGYRGSSIESVRLMETLASHGFIVMAPTHSDSPVSGARLRALGDRAKETRDRVADLRCVLRMQTQIVSHSPPDGRMPFRVAALGLVGDSRGAATILAFAEEHGPAATPPLKAAMLIALARPASAVPETLASITAPTLLVGGTLDTVTPEATHVDPLFSDLASQPVYRLVIKGASHFHFMNVKDIGEAVMSAGVPKWLWPWTGARPLTRPYEACTDPASESVGVVQSILSRYGSAFFRRHLLDHHNTEDILSSISAAQASGAITIQSRTNQQ
jgi:predicted dienelactone hydrolase